MLPPQALRNGTATAELTSQGTTSWSAVGKIYPDRMQMEFEGASFPMRGLPESDCVHGISIAKRLLVRLMKTPLILMPKTMLSILSELSWMAVSQHAPARHLSCPMSLEVERVLVVATLDARLSEAYAQVFEFDTAYRFRLHDIARVMTEQDREKTPIRELLRCLSVVASRETTHPQMRKKAKLARFAILAMCLYPSARTSLRLAIRSADLDILRGDEADWYWGMMREDYDFDGKIHAERVETLLKMGYTVPKGTVISKQ